MLQFLWLGNGGDGTSVTVTKPPELQRSGWSCAMAAERLRAVLLHGAALPWGHRGGEPRWLSACVQLCLQSPERRGLQP